MPNAFTTNNIDFLIGAIIFVCSCVVFELIEYKLWEKKFNIKK